MVARWRSVSCRSACRAGISRTGVYFTFHGSDEGTEVFGNGDAELEPDGTLTGEINFHNGDDMPFIGKR